MKLAGYLLLLLPLIFANSVFAGNSEVHTSIVNEVNSSSTNSNSSSNCSTEIHMESNGEVIEKKTDDCGSIDLKTSDGNSHVIINNNSTSTNNPKTTPSVTLKTTPTGTVSAEKLKKEIQEKLKKAKAHAEKELEKQKEAQKNWIEKIFDLVKSLFAF